MSDTAKKRKRATVEAMPRAVPPEPEEAEESRQVPTHEPATCPVTWCPVCLAVTAVQPVNPELVEHLLKAGTEFFLALRSLIDARADDVAGRREAGGDAGGDDPGWHKIDIG